VPAEGFYGRRVGRADAPVGRVRRQRVPRPPHPAATLRPNGVAGRAEQQSDRIGAAPDRRKLPTPRSENETISTLKDYTESGQFSRGTLGFSADAGLVFTENLDVEGSHPHPRYAQLLEPLPEELIDSVFQDRVHGYIPGWEVPKITPASVATGVDVVTEAGRRPSTRRGGCGWPASSLPQPKYCDKLSDCPANLGSLDRKTRSRPVSCGRSDEGRHAGHRVRLGSSLWRRGPAAR
jgi:hypothetical protein